MVRIVTAQKVSDRKSIGRDKYWCKKYWTVPKIVPQVQYFYDHIILPKTVIVLCCDNLICERFSFLSAMGVVWLALDTRTDKHV